MEFAIEPIEGSTNIVLLATAVVVLAGTEPSAPEIETQHRHTERVQRFHGVEDDLVVERTSKQRVGMANNCGMRRLG